VHSVAGAVAPRPDRRVLAKNLVMARLVRGSSARTSRRTRVVPISSEITALIVVSNPSGNGIAARRVARHGDDWACVTEYVEVRI